MQHSESKSTKEPEMRGPYGFDQNENCQTCKMRTVAFFASCVPGRIEGL